MVLLPSTLSRCLYCILLIFKIMYFSERKNITSVIIWFFLFTLDILPFDEYFSANSLSFVYIFSWGCFPSSYLLSGHFMYGWELLHLLCLCLNESPLIKTDVQLKFILVSEYKVRWVSTFPPFQMIAVTTILLISKSLFPVAWNAPWLGSEWVAILLGLVTASALQKPVSGCRRLALLGFLFCARFCCWLLNLLGVSTA